MGRKKKNNNWGEARMSQDYVAVLDADACIKMGRLIAGGGSHLSVMLPLFKETYIHEYVYREITKPPDVVTHVTSLIQDKKIEVITDADLLGFLSDWLPGKEKTVCHVYLNLLSETLDFLHEDHPLPQIYSSLYSKTYSDIDSLIKDMDFCEKSLREDMDVGEVKTIVLTRVLDYISLSTINLYVSNDRRARKLLVNVTDGKVNACTPLASFLFLKKAGMTKEECNSYFRKYSPRERMNVWDSSGKKVNLEYRQIFEDLFDNTKKIELTVEGVLKYE
ncbi:hypothetical protein [Bacillus cereus]|uniref:hypothetical protein n=2 Tax=Bacillaceae TaxID=186817 RepID=UPI001EE223DC|nr:hypothetical protein [Bacillus cereus]